MFKVGKLEFNDALLDGLDFNDVFSGFDFACGTLTNFLTVALILSVAERVGVRKIAEVGA